MVIGKLLELANFYESLGNNINEESVSRSLPLLSEIRDILETCTESGVASIKPKLSEKNYVKIRKLVSSMLVAEAATSGRPELLLLAKTDALSLFTDSFFFAVLGILLEDEVV